MSKSKFNVTDSTRDLVMKMTADGPKLHAIETVTSYRGWAARHNTDVPLGDGVRVVLSVDYARWSSKMEKLWGKYREMAAAKDWDSLVKAGVNVYVHRLVDLSNLCLSVNVD
jgi:acyl dehydratase